MINPAIVVIAYNRENSLKRVLDSILKADYSTTAKESMSGKCNDSDTYCNEDIPLIISIDKSDNNAVAEIANSFEWPYGNKRVVLHNTNLGLKKHVLECGNYVDEYENIIVLEDDLYVSKGFYKYACSALEFVSDDERIAGVSLYNHLLNVHVREPFEAVNDGFDNYYMQFAQSWGQAYTKTQWHGFLNWLKGNDNKPIAASNVPENVSSWSDKSWLKYYIKYVIEEDKYFIYPRVSYTTNFGDEGTHADSAVSDLQVPLAGAVESEACRDFCFSKLDESKAIYDSYYENIMLPEILVNSIKRAVDDGLADIKEDSIGIDLYGYKQVSGYRFLVSSKAYPYKVIKTYGRQLRPIDMNIIEDISGNDFFVYDTSVNAEAPAINDARRVLYNYRALNLKKMVSVMKYRLLKK